MQRGVDSGLIRCIVVPIYGGSRPHHDQYNHTLEISFTMRGLKT
jgi:hypothetical protein